MCPRGRASHRDDGPRPCSVSPAGAGPFSGVLGWDPTRRSLSLCSTGRASLRPGAARVGLGRPGGRGPRGAAAGRRPVPRCRPNPGSQGCSRVHRTPAAASWGARLPVRAGVGCGGNEGAFLCSHSRLPTRGCPVAGQSQVVAPALAPAKGSVCGTQAFHPGQLARPCPGRPECPRARPARAPLHVGRRFPAGA